MSFLSGHRGLLVINSMSIKLGYTVPFCIDENVLQFGHEISRKKNWVELCFKT